MVGNNAGNGQRPAIRGQEKKLLLGTGGQTEFMRNMTAADVPAGGPEGLHRFRGENLLVNAVLGVPNHRGKKPFPTGLDTSAANH